MCGSGKGPSFQKTFLFKWDRATFDMLLSHELLRSNKGLAGCGGGGGGDVHIPQLSRAVVDFASPRTRPNDT